MPLNINWYTNIVEITSPTTSVPLQTLHDFVEDTMVSPEGLSQEAILQPEGKIEDPNNPGIYSQIILRLNSPWQLQFWQGSGYTRVYGGKIVGGLNNQPIKATGFAGDITVLESPVDGVTVASGSGLSTEEHDKLMQVQNPPSQILNDYKADVSGLSTEANASANKDAVIAAMPDISNLEVSLTEADKIALVNQIWDEIAVDHQVEGSVGNFLWDVKKITVNKVTKAGDVITIYEPDGVTVWKRYSLANGGGSRYDTFCSR